MNSNRRRKFHEKSFGKSKPALTTSQNVEVFNLDKTIPKNANTVSFFKATLISTERLLKMCIKFI
ncbi:MAG: hypothetical protein BGP14_09295 [Sphingobacteriales bacterium 44-15]|nr:MAG: hypothetical protein BGP14_09295 [Sphingobacteriales bacterium 44-15]